MSFVPFTRVAQAVVRQEQSGQPINNVLHFYRADAINSSNLQSLCDALLESWTGAILPYQSFFTQLKEVTARDLSSADGQVLNAIPAASLEGGVGGDALPANVAFCLTHRTGFAGRSRRGRTYIGGLAEVSCVGSYLTPAFVANFQDGLNTVKAELALTGWLLAVASRYAGGLLRSSGQVTVVQSVVARDARVDSQRGRLPS